jgi:class III poly(R)-hydroxyalkanoic acid synthase PhaE subunit
MMTEKTAQNLGGEDLFSLWSQSMTDAWGAMFKLWAPPDTEPGSEEKTKTQKGAGGSERTSTAMESAFKNWQAISAAMTAPDSILALFKGVGAMPETLAKLSRSTLNGFLEMQQKALERAGKLGEHVDAYSFSDIDENLFRTWTAMYEKEFSRFFQVPPLGLHREYQERAAKATDAYNRYQASLGEFMRLLALPLGRSVTVLQEKIAALAEEGALPEDGKAYYDMWIKVLEGHYMTLFQTPEYMESLAQTLNCLSAFKNSRNAVIEDLLKGMPVPTQSEMDDLYEEIHRLKRRLRELEKEGAT